MSRWFRHYAGMMRDDKLVRIAIKTKQSIERVLWVWGAVLESAAEIDDAGRFDFDADEAAYFLRVKPAAISSILSALSDADHIDGATVSKWKSRQFQSDRSKERVAAHRAKKRQGNADGGNPEASRNGDVTLQQRHCIAPETETETEEEEPNGSPSDALDAADAQSPAKPAKRRKVAKPDDGEIKPHRMPADWKPGPLPPGITALTDLWPEGRLAREAEVCRDYWLDRTEKRPGWDRTFHNRIRTIHDQVLREARAHDRSQAHRGQPAQPSGDGFTTAVYQQIRGGRPSGF